MAGGKWAALRWLTALGAASLCHCALLVDAGSLGGDGEPGGRASGLAADGAGPGADVAGGGDPDAWDDANMGSDDEGGPEAAVEAGRADAPNQDARSGDGAADGARSVDTGAPDGSTGNGEGGPVDAGAPDAVVPGDAAGDAAAGDGATDACTLVRHTNGLGQSWRDCAPLGTYDQAEATSACDAFASGCTTGAICNLSEVSTTVSDGMGGTMIYLWVYGTTGSAILRPGDVGSASRLSPCSLLSSPAGRWQ